MIYVDGDLRVAPTALPGHTHVYLGHEVVGEIIEIGDDVQQLQVGDRVALQHGSNCLSSGVQPLCRSCASGNYSLCERGVLPGPHSIGGGWSEEMLLHEQQLFRVPPDMTDTQAVLLEPSAVAVHAVLRHIPQAGDRVLIIGAGTIGLLTLQIVRALAPQAEISVLARYPFQVEKATRMGAAHIIYPQDSYSGVQQATQAQLYKGMLGNQMLLGGYDVIYDTIGNQGTIHNALRWARAKATIVLVGLSLHMMHIDLTPVWYQEINLIGTLGQGMETWPLGTHEQRSTFSITTDLITHGLLQPEQLVTHHFALNNYRQALMTAINKRDQRAIKVVFDYSLLPASVVPNVRASARQRRPIAVDLNQIPTLTTRDLAQKEPVQPLAEHLVTPMPSSPIIPTIPFEQPVPVVSEPTIVIQEQPLPTTFGLESLVQEPSLTSTNELELAVDAHVLPTQPIIPATESAQAVPLPGEELLHEPDKTMSNASPMEEQTRAGTPTVPTERAFEPFKPFDEAPLNDLEWLDIIAAEHEAQEEQYTPETQEESSLPPIDTQPSLPEEVWPLEEHVSQEEPVVREEMYQDNQEDMDALQEGEPEEPYHDTEETATNTTHETLLTTKTTKAITPGKQRSKHRYKGKNTMGSYRS
ncbi:MAG: hypothetical protein NVS4B11_12970 [Ktedonobacteraceae bacterium]